MWGTLAVLGQLRDLFWHPRGPKVEILKKVPVSDLTNYSRLKAFAALFHYNRRCVCRTGTLPSWHIDTPTTNTHWRAL